LLFLGANELFNFKITKKKQDKTIILYKKKKEFDFRQGVAGVYARKKRTGKIRKSNLLTMTITGLVLIFFARAAYRNVLIVSLAFDLAGDTHAICSIEKNVFYRNISMPSVRYDTNER